MLAYSAEDLSHRRKLIYTPSSDLPLLTLLIGGSG